MSNNLKHKMEINYRVKVEVIDTKTGKKLAKRNFKGQSFLKNFASLCRLCFMRGDASETEYVLDTTGTSRTLLSAYSPSFPNYSPATGYKMKCCAGSSDTPFSRDQYNCVSPIATFPYLYYSFTDDGTKKIVTASFAWMNDTGVTQTVREVALIITVCDAGNVVRTLAITRDLVSPPVEVPAGSTLAVGYTINIPW